MISCEKSSQLISKQMDEPLSIWEKVQLYSHTFFCWCCLRFQKQIIHIREALREVAHEAIAFERFHELSLPSMSHEAKARILLAIRAKL